MDDETMRSKLTNAKSKVRVMKLSACAIHPGHTPSVVSQLRFTAIFGDVKTDAPWRRCFSFYWKPDIKRAAELGFANIQSDLT